MLLPNFKLKTLLIFLYSLCIKEKIYNLGWNFLKKYSPNSVHIWNVLDILTRHVLYERDFICQCGHTTDVQKWGERDCTWHIPLDWQCQQRDMNTQGDRATPTLRRGGWCMWELTLYRNLFYRQKVVSQVLLNLDPSQFLIFLRCNQVRFIKYWMNYHTYKFKNPAPWLNLFAWSLYPMHFSVPGVHATPSPEVSWFT